MFGDYMMLRRLIMMKDIKIEPSSIVEVTEFGDVYPFTEFANLNQSRVIHGDGITTVENYSYVNNQPGMNSCPVVSNPGIPTVDSSTTWMIERNSAGNTKSTEEYITSLGAGFYKHTVVLGSPLLLDSEKSYCFMVRNQGNSGFYDYTSVGVRSGTATPSFGIFFGADLSNYDSSANGTTWIGWYESRFSYQMAHPYYLAINGVTV